MFVPVVFLYFENSNFIFPASHRASNFHESHAVRFLKNYVLFLIDRIKDFLKIIRFRRPVIIEASFFPGPIIIIIIIIIIIQDNESL